MARPPGAQQPAPSPVSLGALLREALRSPLDLLAIVASVLVAMVVTSPLPTWLWGPATLLLAAVPGTLVMNRVRRRAESRTHPEQ